MSGGGEAGDLHQQAARSWGPARAEDVLEVVAAFGLAHLYDAAENPTGRLGAEA